MSPRRERTDAERPPHEAWITCSRCHRLHRVRELLAFEPVCPACAAG